MRHSTLFGTIGVALVLSATAVGVEANEGPASAHDVKPSTAKMFCPSPGRGKITFQTVNFGDGESHVVALGHVAYGPALLEQTVSSNGMHAFEFSTSDVPFGNYAVYNEDLAHDPNRGSKFSEVTVSYEDPKCHEPVPAEPVLPALLQVCRGGEVVTIGDGPGQRLPGDEDLVDGACPVHTPILVIVTPTPQPATPVVPTPPAEVSTPVAIDAPVPAAPVQTTSQRVQRQLDTVEKAVVTT